MTTLHGHKIVLRPHRPGDASVILQGAHDPTLRYFTGTKATFTPDQIDRYIANFAIDQTRVGFIIADPVTLDALGEVIILDMDTHLRCAGIRITMFDAAALNQGFGSEAMRLAVDYAFSTLKLHRLGLEVYSFNPRAVHVYQKIGFKVEGRMRDTMLENGTYYDTILMSILENEWQPSGADG